GKGRSRTAAAQAPTQSTAEGSINSSEAQSREKTGPLRVRFAVRRRGGRQSPSRGEQLTTLRLQSGRMGNRLPPVTTVCRGDFLTQRKGLHASHAAIAQSRR